MRDKSVVGGRDFKEKVKDRREGNKKEKVKNRSRKQ